MGKTQPVGLGAWKKKINYKRKEKKKQCKLQNSLLSGKSLQELTFIFYLRETSGADLRELSPAGKLRRGCW